MIPSHRMNRRGFLGVAAAGAGWAVVTRAAEPGAPGSPRSFKAAVIGHTGQGDYGHSLDTIFMNRPGVETVAVADPDPAGGARTAARIGAPRAYAAYEEMLAKERPGLVCVAMRQSPGHYPAALAALRAGAHVYLEKPFTTDCAQADELLAEASARKLQIAVAHTLRVHPSIVRLKRAIQEGVLGDLLEMRAHGKQDARAGGEDLMVLGTHLFDLMRLFAGDPLWCSARVLAQGRDVTLADARRVRDDVGRVAGDQVHAQFAFGGGIHALFTSAGPLRRTLGEWGLELLGSRGAARIVCDVAPLVFLRRDGAWRARGGPSNGRRWRRSRGRRSGSLGRWLTGWRRWRKTGSPSAAGATGPGPSRWPCPFTGRPWTAAARSLRWRAAAIRWGEGRRLQGPDTPKGLVRGRWRW